LLNALNVEKNISKTKSTSNAIDTKEEIEKIVKLFEILINIDNKLKLAKTNGRNKYLGKKQNN
jgi:hypothetical protein